MEQELETGNVAEQQLQRALTDPSVAPLSTVFKVEELEKLNYIKTPTDTPLLNMLREKGAVRTATTHYEWTESTLNTTYTSFKYSAGVISGIDQARGTDTRADNHIMSVGQVVKVSGIAQEILTPDDNAVALETKSKFAQLLLAMEYFLWRGDHTTNADETDGLQIVITTAVDNGSAVISEVKLQQAIVDAINAGCTPDTLFCSLTVAQAIANLAQDRVQMVDVNTAQGGIGQQAMFYNTPFGYRIRIVPVRTSFITATNAFVVDSSLVTLRYLGKALTQTKQLASTDDSDSLLMKSYFGLQVKNASSMRKITNITEALA